MTWLDRSLGAAAIPALGWQGSVPAGTPRARIETADDDARLVEEFRRTRSDDVFKLLVDRHKEKVFRLALAILGPGFEGEAEEVTQEVFVTAFERLSAFRGESRFGTWLYRIGQRKAIDCRRSAHVRRSRMDGEVRWEIPPPIGPIASPHERAEARQDQRVLAAAIREMPDPYPTVLRLFYWLDRSVAEIAEVLGVAPGTVKSLLFRARHLLYERLSKKGFPDANELP
jgi:RNA polymerase sigma-70 factor (ECF subfamily)